MTTDLPPEGDKKTKPKERPASELVRAARIRNNLRVDFSPEEFHERMDLAAEWVTCGDLARRAVIARRMAVLDHGHKPSPIPTWARVIAARAPTPQPTKRKASKVGMGA